MKSNTFAEKLVKYISTDVSKKRSAFYMDTNKELSIFRCISLLDYNENCIKVKLTDGIMVILGEDLGMKTFSNTEITVCGSIKSIVLEDNNG